MDIFFRDGGPEIPGRVLFRQRFSSDIESKDRVIQIILSQLEELGFAQDASELFRYRLCLDEVLQNSIQHGNKMSPDKFVWVVLFAHEDSWGLVATDEGEGFGQASIPPIDGPEALLRENGRGLWILSEYMDHVSYYDGGRTAYLVKQRVATTG